MRNLLITGFTPFNGMALNPSYEAVKALPNNINDILLYKKEINTSFETSWEELDSYIQEIKPDIIINVGVAAGRENVNIEKQAFNERFIAGQSIKILLEGPSFLETTLDYNNITNHVKACELSLSAGRYVCNYLMYQTLYHTLNTSIKVGFIHVPAIKEMNMPNSNIPYMSLEDIIRVLEDIIKTL